MAIHPLITCAFCTIEGYSSSGYLTKALVPHYRVPLECQKPVVIASASEFAEHLAKVQNKENSCEIQTVLVSSLRE